MRMEWEWGSIPVCEFLSAPRYWMSVSIDLIEWLEVCVWMDVDASTCEHVVSDDCVLAYGGWGDGGSCMWVLCWLCLNEVLYVYMVCRCLIAGVSSTFACSRAKVPQMTCEMDCDVRVLSCSRHMLLWWGEWYGNILFVLLNFECMMLVIRRRQVIMWFGAEQNCFCESLGNVLVWQASYDRDCDSWWSYGSLVMFMGVDDEYLFVVVVYVSWSWSFM